MKGWTTGLLCLAAACGCGGRPDGWNALPSVHHAVGLQSSFVLIDDSVHVASFFVSGPALELTASRQPAGVGTLAALPSPDGRKLYVLTQGVQPRRRSTDERPGLWVYDGTGSGTLIWRYELDEPLSGLSIDPQGQFAVIYATGTAGSFVENRNELIIVDVTRSPGADNPVLRTLRSFGGVPQRLTFTPTLGLPNEARRLLIIETDQEVSLLDLNHLDRSEKTVLLSSPDVPSQVRPAAVLVDDGDPERTDDTRVAIRTNQQGVTILTLVPLDPAKIGQTENDYDVVVNNVLSSVPTDFAFVKTDAGRRLAVLDPAHTQAVLVDPDTTVSTPVDMPATYGNMAVVTALTSSSDPSDVALLWGGSASAVGVAFWSLGKSVGQPYRSVEMLNSVSSNVANVVDVPAPNEALKILVPSSLESGSGAAGDRQFYVLNLANRTAAPMFTTADKLAMTVSPDGTRAWFFQTGTTRLAKVDLGTLHPQNLLLENSAVNVFDIARTDGGRAIVALHSAGNYGATVFDALAPDEANVVRHVGLLQGGF